MPGRGGRRVCLRGSRRREPRLPRQPFAVDQDQADPDPPRTGRRLHGRDLRPPHRQGRRLPGDPGPGRDQPRHRRRLRPARRHADADDHRPEADQEVQAGPLPDPRRGRHDGADHQVHPPARLGGQHPLAASARPSAWPRRRSPAPSTSSSPRTSPTSRPTRTPLPKRSLVRRPVADEKSIRAAVKRIEQAKSPILVIGAGANRKMTGRMLAAVRREDRHPVRHHPARQGRGRRDRIRSSSAARRCRPATSCHRAIERGRPDHQRRPRRDREAAVLHAARRRRGDPRQLPLGRGRSGLLPADRGDRRHRQRDLADQGRHRSPGQLGLLGHDARPAPAEVEHTAKLDDDRASRSIPPYLVQADPRGDAGRRHHLPRQRRLQDLVRPQLRGAPAEHRAARQRAGDDGRRPALGDGLARWSIRTARSWRSAATAAS